MSTAAGVRGERLLRSGAGTRSAAYGPAEWGLLAVISSLWGSSFLFMELGLESFHPGVITMVRVALGAAALALVPKARQRIERADLPRVALLGVVWMAVPLMLFPIAQQWIDSSVAGMVNGAVPLFTAAWAALLFHRVPRGVHLVGLGLGFLGVAAIAWPEVAGSQATALGVALVVVAVLLYGLATNIAVPLQQRYGALPVLLRAQLVALVLVVPFGMWSLPGSRWSWSSALAMVPLGVLGTGVAFVMMATLVGRVGATRGSVSIYFVPVVAISLGVLLLGERITVPALAGTALVLAGAWLASRREREPAAEVAQRR